MAIINYPTFLQPSAAGGSGSGDIVGFNLTLTDRGPQSPRYISFGQAFEAGKVATDAALVANIGTQTVLAQMDYKTRHPDGSVRFAVITVPAPAMTGLVQGMLSLGGTVAPHLPVLTLLKGYECTVTFAGAVTGTYDIGKALMTAIRAKTSSYWLRGENAVQTRVDIPLKSSLHLVADVTCYEDGTFLTDLQMRNDHAMRLPLGGPMDYSATIRQGAAVVFTSGTIHHAWATEWRRVFRSDTFLPTSDTHNVQHDVAYLIRAGVLPNYDLTSGIDSGHIDSYATTNVAPLANPGWYYAMPSGGHRDDIGAMPGWYGRWVKCQSWEAARQGITMANGAGSIPWHHWDPVKEDYLSLKDFPSLWIDNSDRGESDLQPKVPEGPWYLDNAHAPAVGFVPYLLTGDRYYLDQINAQASRQVFGMWNGPRKDDKGIVMTGTDAFEVRAQVWTFRSIIEAAWANPDSSPTKKYWLEVYDNNIAHILTWVMPTWTEAAGEIAGYHYGVYGYTQMAPWQQDYYVSVLGMAFGLRVRNSSAPLKIAKWAQRFQIGRFTHQADGFGWSSGGGYQITIASAPYTWLNTWPELGSANDASNDLPTDGSDFTALGLMMLATIYNITSNGEALAAYNALKAKNAAGARLADYQGPYPQFHIVPVGAGA